MTSPSQDRIFGANSSLAIKAPVRVATTANITLSGEQTIDGVAVVTDDRVLVKNQTDATENGIYIADTSTWQRAPDFDGNYDVVTGSLVAVVAGTTAADTMWRVSTTGTITIDSSDIDFEQAVFSDAQSVSFTQAGTGAVQRTMQDKGREIVSVRDFGAVGDGVTNDQSAFDDAVDYCKTTGQSLLVPAGEYNAALNIDWAVQLTSRDAIAAAGGYNPATFGAVGLNFSTTLEKGAIIMLQSIFSRLKDCRVQGGHFNENVVIYSAQECIFEDITTDKVLSLAYGSNTIGHPLYPQKPYLVWGNPATDGPGDVLWCNFRRCQAQALVIYGAAIATHNVNQWIDCNFQGALNANRQTGANNDFLDHHGASRYIDMIAGQNFSNIFVGCDFSYSDFPLWNTESRPVTDVGCYYESCTNNFYTAGGVTASPAVANIIGGSHWDLSVQPDIGVNAVGIHLIGRLGAGYAAGRIDIENTAGSLDFKDQGTSQTRMSYVNRGNDTLAWGGTGYFEGLGNLNPYVNGTTPAWRVGNKVSRHFTTLKSYRKIDDLAAAGTTNFLVLQPVGGAAAYTSIEGQARVKISVLGSITGNSPGNPVMWEGYTNITGKTWANETGVVGSLVGTRVTAVVTEGAADGKITFAVNNTSAGIFSGEIIVEIEVCSVQATATASDQAMWELVHA